MPLCYFPSMNNYLNGFLSRVCTTCEHTSPFAGIRAITLSNNLRCSLFIVLLFKWFPSSNQGAKTYFMSWGSQSLIMKSEWLNRTHLQTTHWQLIKNCSFKLPGWWTLINIEDIHSGRIALRTGTGQSRRAKHTRKIIHKTKFDQWHW